MLNNIGAIEDPCGTPFVDLHWYCPSLVLLCDHKNLSSWVYVSDRTFFRCIIYKGLSLSTLSYAV